eukprot:2795267-Rhodomonas_salina.2
MLECGQPQPQRGVALTEAASKWAGLRLPGPRVTSRSRAGAANFSEHCTRSTVTGPVREGPTCIDIGDTLESKGPATLAKRAISTPLAGAAAPGPRGQVPITRVATRTTSASHGTVTSSSTRRLRQWAEDKTVEDTLSSVACFPRRLDAWLRQLSRDRSWLTEA